MESNPGTVPRRKVRAEPGKPDARERQHLVDPVARAQRGEEVLARPLVGGVEPESMAEGFQRAAGVLLRVQVIRADVVVDHRVLRVQGERALVLRQARLAVGGLAERQQVDGIRALRGERERPLGIAGGGLVGAVLVAHPGEVIPVHGHLRLECDGLLDMVVRPGEILLRIARDGPQPVGEAVARFGREDALDVSARPRRTAPG